MALGRRGPGSAENALRTGGLDPEDRRAPPRRPSDTGCPAPLGR
jgi:hypothetical protein